QIHGHVWNPYGNLAVLNAIDQPYQLTGTPLHCEHMVARREVRPGERAEAPLIACMLHKVGGCRVLAEHFEDIGFVAGDIRGGVVSGERPDRGPEAITARQPHANVYAPIQKAELVLCGERPRCVVVTIRLLPGAREAQHAAPD